MSVVDPLEKPYLAPDVVEELNDPKFANRKHGSRATHTSGCHGPLCRRAETLRGRRRSEIRALKNNREYIPSRNAKRDDSRHAELSAAQAWHEQDLARRRAEASLDTRTEKAAGTPFE